MKKIFAIDLFLSLLLINLGTTAVLADTFIDLSFDSRVNATDSKQRTRSNNLNTQIAQSITPFAGKQPIGWSQRDFAIPDSPAGKLIGSSTAKIPNISTPGALSTNLLNGLNSDGKFATGIAIDTVPYLIFRGSGMTLEEYQQGGLPQFLSNTSFSIATHKETASDTARVGLAAQFKLINKGDRRMDEKYLKKLENFAKTITEQASFGDLTTDEQNKEIGKELKKFKESPEYTVEINRLEQQPIWTVAVGTSFITPTGRYSDLRGDGMGVWTTYREGIGGNSQLIFHGAYRSGERIADSKGAFFNGDTLLLGTRIRMGEETNSQFSLEAAYNIENRQGSTSNSYLSLGVGLEQKVVPKENLWLIFSFNNDIGRQNGGDFRFNSGIRWEFGPAGNN
ncbi:hypothetical protein [Chamaesiphon sp. VAR_48_metabat_135_sub]|uniref:hypothetical protein n=1 Tax=Chamaesiphon sp. VAR_48_metabat_135_sub TaxID=2964699 RepID=UPI00286A6CC0|nr:hypothetical protein [Chamaesiphon sp. VAR_48_metabat_135_sub]